MQPAGERLGKLPAAGIQAAGERVGEIPGAATQAGGERVGGLAAATSLFGNNGKLSENCEWLIFIRPLREIELRSERLSHQRAVVV